MNFRSKKSIALLEEIQLQLDDLSAGLVKDLVPIGAAAWNSQREGFDVIYFEYSYEDLQLYYWIENGKEVANSSVLPLPIAQSEGLLSAALRDRMFDLEDVLYEDESFEDHAVEEEVEQFHAARCALFEHWFITCWSQARKQMAGDIQAYFSVHDSYYKTKLD